MVIGLLAFVAGMALVVWGAERFTDGAIRIAARLALSTFYVGAVMSGLEPENLASGIAAALGGLPQIALGTVIGSTVFLLTGGLGLTLLLVPMDVNVPREGPAAMAISLVLFGDVSRLRRAEQEMAARILGVQRVTFLDYEDGELAWAGPRLAEWTRSRGFATTSSAARAEPELITRDLERSSCWQNVSECEIVS